MGSEPLGHRPRTALPPRSPRVASPEDVPWGPGASPGPGLGPGVEPQVPCPPLLERSRQGPPRTACPRYCHSGLLSSQLLIVLGESQARTSSENSRGHRAGRPHEQLLRGARLGGPADPTASCGSGEVLSASLRVFPPVLTGSVSRCIGAGEKS